MTPERWAQVQEIFHKALAVPESDRDQFLAQACPGDEQLKLQVTALLAADSAGGGIVDGAIQDIAAGIVTASQAGLSFRDFDPYRLEDRKLGEGAMGVVYLGEHKLTGQRVAIKIALHAVLSPAYRERFLLERTILGKLNHPCIAQLHHADVLKDGTPWFAMEYVEGDALSDYCTEHKLSIRERLVLIRAVCEAVHHVHLHAIVHRDLKPANVLVTKDGTPKLLDFGIGKMVGDANQSIEKTVTGLRVMTIAYASPEQLRGADPAVSMDVYALGVIIYELLAGRLPFDFDHLSIGEAERLILEQDAERVSIAASRNQSIGSINKAEWNDLDALCRKAMHKEVERRYRSVEALIRDIDHFLNQEPLEAQPDSLGYRVRKFLRRHRTAMMTASAVMMLTVAIVTFFAIRLAVERNHALAEAERTRSIQAFMLDLMGNGDPQAAPSKDLTVMEAMDRGAAVAARFRSDPEMMVEVYLTLGRGYEQLNQFQNAEKLLNQAFEITRAGSKQTEQTLRVLTQLGVLNADLARMETAEKLAREAVEIGKRLGIDSNDPLMLDAESSLGRILVQTGDFKQAIPILESIVRLPLSGNEETITLAESLTALAVADQYTGKYDDALALNRRALDLDRKLHGNKHPRVATDLANIATVIATQGGYEEAAALYREAGDIFAAAYGPDNPQTVQVRSFSAKMALQAGKLDEAEQLMNDVLPREEKAFGTAVHPVIAFSHSVLGGIALKRGKLPAAEKEFSKSVEINQKLFGESDYRSAAVVTDFAATLLKQGRYTEAERSIRPAVKTLTDHPLPGNISVGIAELVLGEALLREKRYQEAEAPLNAALEIFKVGRGGSVFSVSDCLKDLMEVYQGLGSSDKAEAIQAQIRNIHSPGNSSISR